MVTYPKDWRGCLLRELGIFTSGDGFPLQYQGDISGIYPFYKVSDFNNVGNERVMSFANNYISEIVAEKLHCHIIPSHSIIFAKIGAAIYLERKRLNVADCCVDNNMMAFTANENVDVHYLCYVFQKLSFGDFVRVTALPSLSPKIIGGIKIHLPQDIAEQKAIAATLSSFDTHIDNLTVLIEKKKAIRDGALSDLMSGRARLVGFNGEWGETTLGEAGRFISGNGFPVSYQGHTSGKYPFYKVSDFNKSGNEYCLIAANNYVSEEVAGKLNCNVIPSDSIVFAKIGAAIFLERKRITNSDCCIDNNMMAFNILEGNCPRYFCYLLQEMNLSDYSCITALPSLSGKTLGKVAIHLPGVDEQKAIADILTSMDTEIQNLEAERDKMQAIRAGAMDDLLTGRVRLPM